MKIPYTLLVLLNKLDAGGCGPIYKSGDELRCRCPAHDDSGPSLYVRHAGDKILVRCGAGCDVRDICDRIDHPLADLTVDADDEMVDYDAEGGVDDAEPEAAATQRPAAPSAPRLCQLVYLVLLTALELTTKHFDDLRKRGLSATEIERRSYRTADPAKARTAVDKLLQQFGREPLLTVPGFADKGGRVYLAVPSGLLIPARDAGGNIAALKVRRDAGAGGAKYFWVSSPKLSCGNVVHVPLGITVPSPTVRLTEGELKADVAFALSGIPTVSAPGVTNWALAIPVLKALGAKKVLLAMDQDGKPGTLAEVERALFSLTRDGFDVELECWDGKAAKGIDDLLASGGRPELVTGLAAAVRVRSLRESPAEAAEDEPEPAPFPVDVFPPALAAYCRQVAAAKGTPPDFAGQTMLVTAGAAIGISRALEVQPDSWYEGPRIYAANVGDPSTGKTPAMSLILEPYRALQDRRVKAFKEAKAAYDRAKAAREQAVSENRALPAAERQRLPSLPDEPGRPERFIVGDATVEAMAALLEWSPRGLLSTQDEGVAWVRGMNQYKGGKGNDRQFWLAAWSGTSQLVDRKSRDGEPISIPRPFINVILNLPPDMLCELADGQGRSDGFLDRILFAFPRCAGPADWSEATVDRAAKQAWEATLVRLRTLAVVEAADGLPGPQVVRLSPAARAAWVGWYDAHAAETRSPDLPAQLRGPWGKLRSYAARFILLLHYLWLVQADADEADVGAASVERAVKLIDYYKSHLRLVYSRLRQTPEDNRLSELLEWVRQQGGQSCVRHVVKARKAPTADKARQAFKELEERGFGRSEWRVGGNGRKVQWFVVDPDREVSQ